MNVDEFLHQCACLDLEVGEDGRVTAIGAVADGDVFSRQGHFDVEGALRELDAFVAGSRYLLGHNLLAHDLPVIRELHNTLSLHDKPVIDTLYLSPLAFPENPYHRLVKNYKLVSDSLNDPVADARQAQTVFRDQWQVFSVCDRDLAACYRFCFAKAGEYHGLAEVLAYFSDRTLDVFTACDLFAQLLSNLVCQAAWEQVAHEYLAEGEKRPALSYCLAWLLVAGGNSVLPPWVRHRFPETSSIIRRLRDVHCDDPDCTWCMEQHNPESRLFHFFGFPGFRAQPQGPDGGSLQRAIVRDGLADRPLLAILPTGGGKSLCFQLPALVRYQRRGALTIVISPLQALMKDQVDNLNQRTGATAARALYGMLTPPERGAVLEGIRLGDVGILYVSPEQLRNASFRTAIAHREIGCWVFDEAHCLSKWGHDFRPDYLYAGRFIKEFAALQKMAIPPVQCFTATAKTDVVGELQDYFQRELGQQLLLFAGGVERDNLHFEVYPVSQHEKPSRLQQLLRERLHDAGGSAIVYCATRKHTENIAEYLQRQGWAAESFHAGLDAALKAEVQDRFVSGATRIICATNAFGMGIDKENVRLVVHLDIPGSLENYLQEAGRAGRDSMDADCVLLYDENDIESQFRLSAFSQLGRKDIAQLLRGLRAAVRRVDGDEVIITSGELLRSQFVDASFSTEDSNAGTKVVTAIAWLERAGLVERNENRTQVFQGRPVVRSLEEAGKKISRLNLSQRQQERWLTILDMLMNADEDEGLSADQVAEHSSFTGAKDEPGRETESHRVVRTLYDMAKAGLIQRSMLLTAFIRHKVSNGSHKVFDRVVALEEALLTLLKEEAPDAEDGTWQHLSIVRINQRLMEDGWTYSNPEILRNLLFSLSRDGQGLAGQRGSLDMIHAGVDQYRIKLHRNWQSLRATAKRRQQTASVVLGTMLGKIPPETAPSASLLVEFSLDELGEALRRDLTLFGMLKDPLAAIDRALLYLHEQRVIILQRGLSVFRQAMTIKVQPETRRYSAGDFEPLAHHYHERVFQIHVMNEYAGKGLEKISAALELVLAYFALDKLEFIRRFFPKRNGMLERATSRQSFQRIVADLENKRQEAIVSASETKNMLILAGPGSGKTRTVVHRCAYLLRVKRVRPESMLVLCFNRNAAMTLRWRLFNLVKDDARGVMIQTYHSLAMRLTGRSVRGLEEGGEGKGEPDFDALIREAVQLFKGEKKDIPGLEADEVRDRLLGGYRHILVDEYQDIDSDQYELVSALAGKTQDDKDRRLTILAVGDDDQNIYQFRGTNVEFIKRFREDYQADIFYLNENYRSSASIIKVSNAVIAENRDRMKTAHPMRINRARGNLPAGGGWEKLDPLANGRVQVMQSKNAARQAVALVLEMERLSRLSPAWQWGEVAVLAREWSILQPIRLLCEQLKISISRTFSGRVPIFRIREIYDFLAVLKGKENGWYSADELNIMARPGPEELDSIWFQVLGKVVEDWRREAGEEKQPVNFVLDFFYDALAQQRKEGRFGKGLFLGTAHSAKGMEFAHVFIPDGGWERGGGSGEREEARRLYYVAMTRARETLTLFKRDDCTGQLAGPVDREGILHRKGQKDDKLMQSVCREEYSMLGLEDMYLDYAARFSEDHGVHRTLSRLRTGDRLQLREDKGRLCLFFETMPVAALSKRGEQQWRPRLDQVNYAKIIAMIQRKKEDSAQEYQQWCRLEQWALPLVELRHRIG